MARTWLHLEIKIHFLLHFAGVIPMIMDCEAQLWAKGSNSHALLGLSPCQKRVKVSSFSLAK